MLAAIARAGVRAVLATGWGGLTASREPAAGVFAVDQVPHDLLLPHVAAVVHHGGAGTTGAPVAAGRPQVICPFVADQPLWGDRMHALGVAPAPVDQRALSAERLADRILDVLTDPTLGGAAAELGERIQRENRVAVAVRELETLVRSARRR